MTEENIELFTEFAESVAEICNLLSHKARVLILTSLGKLSLSEVKEKVGLSSFQALQRHVNFLLESDLINKGVDKGVYELTEYGKHITGLFEYFKEVPEVKKRVAEGKKERLRVALAKFGSGLTKQDVTELFEEIRGQEK